MVYSVACFKIQDEKPRRAFALNKPEHGVVAKEAIIDKTKRIIP